MQPETVPPQQRPAAHRAEVCIIQRRLTHYRVAFFEALRERLGRDGINLRLLHGTPNSREATKKDDGSIGWAERLPTRYFLGERLNWLDFARHVRGADLVVLTQENAQLANHWALLKPPAKRIAFWGHGGNLQGNPKSLSERYKRWSTRSVDWYFAYTEISVDLVRKTGFPSGQITCVNNSVDLAALDRNIAEIADADVTAERARLGLGDGPVGVFLGSLYAEKRLEFLIEAAGLIRAQVPEFNLVISGAGPDRALVERAAERHPWVRYVGPRFGRDKALLLRMASLYMNPGLIGLGILDAFAAGLPVMTTDCGLHSPEIAYLDQGKGILTRDDVPSYAEACVELLRDDDTRVRLARGSLSSAANYSLDRMVDHFAAGIVQCLEQVR